MARLSVTKKDIGKKIFEIKETVTTTNYYKVVAKDENEATDLMYKARQDSSAPIDDDDHIIYGGCKDNLEEMKVDTLVEISNNDFEEYGEEDFEYEYKSFGNTY